MKARSIKSQKANSWLDLGQPCVKFIYPCTSQRGLYLFKCSSVEICSLCFSYLGSFVSLSAQVSCAAPVRLENIRWQLSLWSFCQFTGDRSSAGTQGNKSWNYMSLCWVSLKIGIIWILTAICWKSVPCELQHVVMIWMPPRWHLVLHKVILSQPYFMFWFGWWAKENVIKCAN